MTKNAIIRDLRYPIFLITHPEGRPKITNAEKIAAVTRYDCPVVRLKADLSAGVRKPLIPTPNPIMKKTTPMIIRGMAGPIFLLVELLIAGSLVGLVRF